jgi:pyridinium-3,5-biscarboxylic acid mononucleotide sulfurtransferase
VKRRSEPGEGGPVARDGGVGTGEADRHLDAVRAAVRGLGSVALGLSGGVDSSLLAAIAHDTLGARAVAVIARSPSLPRRELDEALGVAASIGIDVEVVDTAEVADPRYAANPRNRCLICKEYQFEAMRAVADRRGLRHLAHGETVDDLDDHRPGRGAAERYGVRAPLREAGMDKAAVRALAHRLGLSVWDKPAFACMASRIPHGDPVTAEKLEQVERSEQHLFDLGFRAFRVRHHGRLARLELEPEDHHRAIDHASDIVAALRAVGFEQVTLDLAGLGASRAGRHGADRPSQGLTALPIVEVGS